MAANVKWGLKPAMWIANFFESRTPKSLLSPIPKHEKVFFVGGSKSNMFKFQSHVQHEEVLGGFGRV